MREGFPGNEGGCWALVLAGGAGERLGMGRPKAFVSLRGRPLLMWSLATLARHPWVSDVMAVVPAGWDAAFRDEVRLPLASRCREGEHMARLHDAVEGGPRRQDSARAGLEAIRARTPESELDQSIVLIHDAARPIVPPSLVSAVIAALRRHGPCAGIPRAQGPVAVLPIVPVTDTLKAVTWPQGEPPPEAFGGRGARCAEAATAGGERCGQVTRTVARKGLWRAQTPQGFFLQSILEAHVAAARANSHATDDVTLYEMRDWPVEAIPGSCLNVKVSRPEDLELLESWLARGGAMGGEDHV